MFSYRVSFLKANLRRTRVILQLLPVLCLSEYVNTLGYGHPYPSWKEPHPYTSWNKPNPYPSCKEPHPYTSWNKLNPYHS
uniref:Putative secreted protein n=1 Tax=Ixodes ricinus TaxID=34613 RepID=A0A147BCQ6_IXORI